MRLWKLKQRKTLLTDFYVFDTETGRRQKNGIVKWSLEARPERFIFGVIYGYNYTRVIHSLKEFHETLKESRFKNKIIFAHNFGNFDGVVLFDNIIQFDPTAIYNDSRFISCTNGNCIFADSLNVFVGTSVEQIGIMMGNKKQKLGNENYQTDWNNEKDRTKAINYCIQDCVIVWDALFSAFDFAGDIKITQASLSMSYYRRYQMPFHIDHNENTKFFWHSYYGGRCEAFKIGKTHARCIDVNSMYPYAMRNCIFPNPKYFKHEINITRQRFDQYLNWYEGTANIEVEHPPLRFGCLPFREPQKNPNQKAKLLFPVGNLTGWWNFNEIRYALSKGVTIKKIHDVVYSEKMPSPFISFVDTLNLMKITAEHEGNEMERDRAKRFSNSLYGKFAQRIDREQIYIRDINDAWESICDYKNKGIFMKFVPFSQARNDGFLVLHKTTTWDLSHAIPSFASYITSFARLVLLEKLFSMEAYKPVYCDTDSIFFENDLGMENELQLGGWKYEKKIITEIRGLKNYKYKENDKEVWRVKGVPVNKDRTLKIYDDLGGESEVNFVTQTGPNSFEYYNLTKSKESLKRNIVAGVPMKREKTIKGVYDKREILENGETKPKVV